MPADRGSGGNQGWVEGEEAKLQQSFSQPCGEAWTIHGTSELAPFGWGGQAFTLWPGSIIYVDTQDIYDIDQEADC